MTKKIKFTALLCLVLLLLNSCSFLYRGQMREKRERGVYIDGEKIEIMLPTANTGMYSLLKTDIQKFIYAASLKAVLLGSASFEIVVSEDSLKSLSTCGEAVIAMINDHPEFFWLNGTARADSEYIAGSEDVKVKISIFSYDYWKNNDLNAAKAEFDSAVQGIVDAAMAQSDMFEKVKLVHDSIIGNVKYDHSKVGEAGEDLESRVFADTAYGALVKGEALCGGYARAFGCIMNKLGIENCFVSGVAGGGKHAWNMIRLGGELYHIDLTWDDRDETDLSLIYSYFCVSDEEISATHKTDEEYSAVKADGEEYNYYIRKGLYFDRYDIENIRSLYALREEKGTFTLKFANEDAFRKACDGILNKNDLKIPSGTISYIKDDENLILTLILS